jgi:hypothetical protein
MDDFVGESSFTVQDLCDHKKLPLYYNGKLAADIFIEASFTPGSTKVEDNLLNKKVTILSHEKTPLSKRDGTGYDVNSLTSLIDTCEQMLEQDTTVHAARQSTAHSLSPSKSPIQHEKS